MNIMRNPKNNFLRVFFIVLAGIFIPFLVIQFIFKNYAIENLGLNSKDAMFIGILLYCSILYGVIVMIFARFIDKKFNIK